MALNPYISEWNLINNTSTASTYTAASTVWADLYRHDIEKAKYGVERWEKEALARTVDKVRSKALKVPRGTSILDVLQTDFDAWAGDVRAAIFN